MRKTRIFVCGPIRGKETDFLAVNVNRALEAAGDLFKLGYAVYVPHTNFLWEMVVPHELGKWMEHDKEWLAVCDAVFRVPGESKGSDAEVALATELGIPVYYGMASLLAGEPYVRGI